MLGGAVVANAGVACSDRYQDSWLETAGTARQVRSLRTINFLAKRLPLIIHLS